MNASIGFALRHRALTVALLVATLGGPTAATAQHHTQKSGDTVRVTPHQMHQLDVARVELFSFRVQKTAIGQIAYNEDTSTVVLTPFPGRVTRLIAKIGDQVKRGDPMFEIDSPEVVLPQNEFVAAVTALNKARSQLALAQISEKRARDLFEGRAGPLKDLQQAEAQLIAAQNDMRSAEVALEAGRNRLRIIGRTEEQIGALEARGAIARNTAIFAPIDGTVIGRKVGPGQYVRSDSNEPLYTIADLSTMWLKAYVPENDIPFIRVGQEVEVRVTALPGRVFKARITVIGSASDAATRRVVVRSEIPNPDGLLKSEMFATFKITAGDDQPSPAVPVESVIREADLATVWVQKEAMVFQRRPVTIGMEQDGRVQVRDGLKTGEQVVARGAIFIDNEWRQ
jgi:cobalt-zinc-cadmium efflux system membrane fusion protein